jgi:hypothetical protein
MATLGSREFQVGYQKLTEVTRVEARGKFLGTWYPAGTVEAPVNDTGPVVTKMAEAQKIIDMQEDEIRQLKRTIAAQGKPVRVVDPTFKAEYRPVPKPGKAK